jgi:hypothetical protein
MWMRPRTRLVTCPILGVFRFADISVESEENGPTKEANRNIAFHLYGSTPEQRIHSINTGCAILSPGHQSLTRIKKKQQNPNMK